MGRIHLGIDRKAGFQAADMYDAGLSKPATECATLQGNPPQHAVFPYGFS